MPSIVAPADKHFEGFSCILYSKDKKNAVEKKAGSIRVFNRVLAAAQTADISIMRILFSPNRSEQMRIVRHDPAADSLLGAPFPARAPKGEFASHASVLATCTLG